MEENEVIYIPYGLDEIDYKQFQLNLANNYLEYLKGRRWAKKLKNVDAWMKAYNNILKQGITGASVENGQWSINHNGENFEYANPLEKSMYEDVASYLVGLMKAMPKRKKEEEKKKTSYDYKTFLQGLLDYIGRELFGGQPDYISKWTDYDELPKNGLRGTTKRQAAMAELLKGYKDYINQHKDEYDFESYNGIDNWNNRVDRALVALNNPEWNDEDKHSLDALGLNYNTWFNNGGSDPLIVGNQQMTRELYVNEYLPQLEKLKKEAEIKTLQAELKKINDNKYKNFRFFNASKLAGTPPTGNDSLLKLNSYASLPLLNGQLLSELIGAFKFAAKNGILQNISKEELQKFGPRWSENRLKKINGLNGFYWDSIGNRVVQPFLNEIPQVGFLDLVNLNRPKTNLEKELEYLNSKIPGITNAEWKELSAIGLDIASILNPEAISGSGMALAAAGLRHSAKNDSNPDWNFNDYLWLGIDYLTGTLGGILLLGDAVLGAKTMATANKAIPIFRKMARLGAWTDLYQAYPGLKEATNKVVNGEELTVGDWRAIGQGLRGLVSHGRLSRQNLGERKVIQESGYTPEQVSSIKGRIRNWTDKTGFTRTKLPKSTTTSTVKVKLNNADTEIPVSAKAKAKIEEGIKKAGKDTTKRNEAVEKVLKDKELMGDKVLLTSDKISVVEPTWIDNKSILSRFGTLKDLFGTQTTSMVNRGTDNFENWLGQRDYWNKIAYGSNRELRGVRNRLGMTSEQQVTQLQLNNPLLQNNPLQQLLLLQQSEDPRYNRAVMNRYKDILSGKFSKIPVKEGTYTINGIEVKVEANGLDRFNLYIDGKDSGSGLIKEGVAKRVAEFIKQQRKVVDQLGKITKKTTKEIGKILLDLKRKGWLKQGGTIDKQKIQKYTEFIKK